jgi:hypothetical protein
VGSTGARSLRFRSIVCSVLPTGRRAVTALESVLDDEREDGGGAVQRYARTVLNLRSRMYIGSLWSSGASPSSSLCGSTEHMKAIVAKRAWNRGKRGQQRASCPHTYLQCDDDRIQNEEFTARRFVG